MSANSSSPRSLDRFVLSVSDISHFHCICLIFASSASFSFLVFSIFLAKGVCHFTRFIIACMKFSINHLFPSVIVSRFFTRSRASCLEIFMIADSFFAIPLYSIYFSLFSIYSFPVFFSSRSFLHSSETLLILFFSIALISSPDNVLRSCILSAS